MSPSALSSLAAILHSFAGQFSRRRPTSRLYGCSFNCQGLVAAISPAFLRVFMLPGWLIGRKIKSHSTQEGKCLQSAGAIS